MQKRPVIGIAMQTLQPIPGELPLCWVMGQKYVRVLRGVGAVPWLIPLLDDDEATLREIYDRLDGLFLTGGMDVDPASYQEDRRTDCGRTDLARDWTELHLVRWAQEDKKPILGVCRGMQVINVALGGSLYQDIASEFKCAIKHDYFPNPNNDFTRQQLVHPIRVQRDTKLRSLLESDKLDVNSMHHQAIRTLAPGLKVTSTAPDDVIESVEGINGQFLIGVQWHPEELTEANPGMRRIFESFIEASAAKSVTI